MNSASKHIGPWLAFDAHWFARHQRTLLWLLNAPLLCVWFRWVLCVSYRGRISEIQPHAISYGDRLVFDKQWRPLWQRTTEFRTHPKYAKRIYFAFRPLWWVLHYWDELVADQWMPQFSFGFDTLTAYPSAGSVSPVDGNVSRGGVNETFSTIRAGSGNSFTNTPTTVEAWLRGSSTTNQFDYLFRGIMCFDTSSLGASAVISAAVFSGYGSSKTSGLGSDNIHVCGATPAAFDTLANSDFGQVGSTSFANIAFASFNTGAYNDFTLNSSGQTHINKTGITALGWRLGWDLNNSFGGTWGSFTSTYMYVRSADQTGTSEDPYLTVTYTVVNETFPAGYFSGERANHPLIRM